MRFVGLKLKYAYVFNLHAMLFYLIIVTALNISHHHKMTKHAHICQNNFGNNRMQKESRIMLE